MIETYSAALPQSAYRASGGEWVVFSSLPNPSGAFTRGTLTLLGQFNLT